MGCDAEIEPVGNLPTCHGCCQGARSTAISRSGMRPAFYIGLPLRSKARERFDGNSRFPFAKVLTARYATGIKSRDHGVQVAGV